MRSHAGHRALTGVVTTMAILTSAGSCSDPVACDPCPAAEPAELRAPSPGDHQEEPSVAVLLSGRVLVAWKEMPAPAGVGSLGLARSDDGGQSWSTSELPRPVGSPGQSDPWLVARASGRVLAARYSDCGVAVAASDDEGASWSSWREMHVGDGCADKPSLSRGRMGPLVLVYHVIETSGDGVRVDLAVSRDDGDTWTAPETVAPEAGERRLAPTAAVLADGSIAVAWWRPDIGGVEATRSNDDGATWATPTVLNSEEGSVMQSDRPLLRPPFPTLAVLGNTLIAAWPDAGSGDWDVVASRSDDGGRTWSDPLPLDSGGPGDQWMVTVAAGPDGRLHAVWYDSADGPTSVRYAVSDDLGRSWSLMAAEPGVVADGRARLGDYLGLDVAPTGEAYTAWTAVRSDSLRVLVARADGLGAER